MFNQDFTILLKEMNTKLSVILVIIIVSWGCRPIHKFDKTQHPEAPVYSDEKNWIALPWKSDIGDTIPKGCNIPENQENAKADVFYVHHTVYNSGATWNADLNYKRINKKAGETIKIQTTAFNAAGRVFAPSYRQAVLKSFFNEEKGKPALDLAYEDIKAAFDYYLKNWNNGRPIILAGHSQGAKHTVQLLKDFFEGKELQKQLIAAYPIGFPFKKDELKNIPLCENEKQTGCYVTWNTFKWKADTKMQRRLYKDVSCVNPLTMQANEVYADDSLNKGGITFYRYKVRANVCDAQVHGNLLWVHRPKSLGFFRTGKSYHVSDINLFYMNIRVNALLRTEEYLKKEN